MRVLAAGFRSGSASVGSSSTGCGGGGMGGGGRRTGEAMEILRALWQGGPASHDGEFFQFSGVELRPVRPPEAGAPGMRPGGPPLLVSGRKPPAMRRAARLGDGWMPYLMSPNAYARSVRVIEDEARAVGRDLPDFEWLVCLYCSVRPDGDRARDEVARFLA